MAEIQTLKDKETSSEQRLELFDEFMQKNPENKNVVEYYDSWGKFYDKDMTTAQYCNPKHVTDAVAKHFGEKKDMKILDIGAGTGVGGKKLQEEGYTNIDALDGSQGMLDVAKGLNVYKNLYQEIISGDKVNCVPPESYDLVVSSGSFYPKHLQGEHLKPIVSTCKKGGLIVISSSPHNDEGINLRPAVKTLTDAGIVEKIAETKVDNWFRDHDGTVYVLRKK